ncbi:pyridoxamine 5'-phosphate oxidase family protein [Sutcliffiella rhizosphaerae]|uniref:General stress protein 26 n=1 Tax=Sutcliffiella rhizosphaerae TaxID=2880967 RepID=A0ABN8AKF3_9BACI|nr:pyridoxamine 5'-phosphate oxidase family protein [Sutcliffiella rhizosphaerae]CAG9623633.1 General stress protein 26 [Sutcliffiella rhizosphaerae]
MNADLKQKITAMISNHKIGTLATIRDNRPYSRFMLFFHEELTLYCATNKNTHKMQDIHANPRVHILLGMDAVDFHKPYVEMEAEASFEDNSDLKQKFWNAKLSEWMKSPEDPDYLLLKLTPSIIRYFESAGSDPEVWER